MKVFFLHILLIFSALITNAQSLSWTEPIKMARDIAQVSVAGTDASGFYVVEEVKKDQSIKMSRYGLSDVKPQWTQTIDVPSGALEQQFESLLHLKDRFFFFTSAFSKESEQFQIFCTMLDQSGKKMADPVLVHYALSENRETAPTFGYSVSPDSAKVLLYFDPPFERKNTEALSFKLYDNSLDLLMEKELLLPYTQEIVQVHSFVIDNSGNIYMMSGRNPVKSSTLYQRPQGGRYVVFFYNYVENKLKEYDVSLKDKQVVSVVFGLNKNQDVVISGYYSNDFKFGAGGTFLFIISAAGGPVKAASFMPFSVDFMSKFMKVGEGEKNTSLSDFFLDHMIMQDDGSMILIGEKYYATEQLVTDPASGRQTMEFRYNFDDIIATKLESNGRQSWNVKIPKRQVVGSDMLACSYQYFITKDGLDIFFNDNGDNTSKLMALSEGEATAWTGNRNSITTVVHLNKAGTFKRETQLNNKETGALLKTDLTSPVPFGPRVLGYEDGKTYKFCVVK